MSNFTFSLGDRVKIRESGEEGAVVGRAEYTNGSPSYFVRYRAADGRATEVWWLEDALIGA